MLVITNFSFNVLIILMYCVVETKLDTSIEDQCMLLKKSNTLTS